jgi:hypothetical protein
MKHSTSIYRHGARHSFLTRMAELLTPGASHETIAKTLNRERYRTARGNRFTAYMVGRYITRYNLDRSAALELLVVGA